MRSRIKNPSMILLASLVLVIAGCQNAPTPLAVTPTTVENLAATADMLRTQVASTVVSEITATQAAIPPTETALPTETQPADTATPTSTIMPPTAPATITPTRYATLWYGYTSTPGPYQCEITAQALKYGTRLTPGVDFDGRWTVKNTGTKNWGAGALEYKYVSGTRFQKNGDSFKVGKIVNTGKTVEIIVDMIAPKEPGAYHAQWALVYGDTDLCNLMVDIRVQ